MQYNKTHPASLKPVLDELDSNDLALKSEAIFELAQFDEAKALLARSVAISRRRWQSSRISFLNEIYTSGKEPNVAPRGWTFKVVIPGPSTLIPVHVRSP